MGISVKGKIVIARYYHSWRASSLKSPAEHGALGCLIYSDPHEDGFVREKLSLPDPFARWTESSEAVSPICVLSR